MGHAYEIGIIPLALPTRALGKREEVGNGSNKAYQFLILKACTGICESARVNGGVGVFWQGNLIRIVKKKVTRMVIMVVVIVRMVNKMVNRMVKNVHYDPLIRRS